VLGREANIPASAMPSTERRNTAKFHFESGRPCLDLVRTLKERRTSAVERLATPADLARWISESGIAPDLTIARLRHMDLEAARDLREAIYDIVAARRRGRAPSLAAVARVNEFASKPLPIPRLSPQGDRYAHMPTGASLPSIFSILARDAINLVSSPLIARVRTCANAACTALFLDTSRPGTRRWCSMESCGNLVKVRSYRARLRNESRRRAD
jgi:predicted RNA-binding Zn ribbon-like protein